MDILHITCTIEVNIEVSLIELQWYTANSNVTLNFTETTFGNGSSESDMVWENNITLSLDLTLDTVSVFDAGEYMCGSNLTEVFTNGEVTNSVASHTLFVASKFSVFRKEGTFFHPAVN